LLTDDSLKTVPFLILGNKIDKEGAVSPDHLAYALGITSQTPETATSVPPGHFDQKEGRLCRRVQVARKIDLNLTKSIFWTEQTWMTNRR
jgi:hypothetical protein